MGKPSRARAVKLIEIGNSKGIRISKALREKYGWSSSLVLEESEEGVFLRRDGRGKLSWSDTYRAMAVEDEDWNDFESTVADGLD